MSLGVTGEEPSSIFVNSIKLESDFISVLWIEKALKMRPILMKGHERPLTFLRYNRDGDLLISCAKDHTPTLWFADNGERLGTYRGHNGAVWCCDISSKFRI